MYKEIAVDPRCMSDIEYYNLLKQHFGYEKGRYVSADPGPWAREAMTHVKESNLRPVRKKSVKNHLNKIGRKGAKEFLLAEDRRYTKADCWNDWHHEQTKIRSFACTLAMDGQGDYIDIENVNEGCDQWNIPASISIDRTVETIIDSLYPLLFISKDLTIVDPYFRISNNPVLTALFELDAGPAIRSLRVATAMNSPSEEDVYQSEYRSLNKNNLSFKWIQVPEKYFHDRYVITEAGAMRSGQGFMPEVEKGIHADAANINIIGKEEAERTLQEIDALVLDNKATVKLSI